MLALLTCAAGCVLMADLLVAKWGAAGLRDRESIFGLTIIMANWLLLSLAACGFLGIRPVVDTVDHRNRAACFAVCGAMVSFSFVFAGGNIGEGEDIGQNVFSVVLGQAGVFAMWWFVEKFGKISRAIVEEHDPASGMRLCGFIIAVGLIFGRAVAGDWHSAPATLGDFARDGWPAPILALVALTVERTAGPSRARPFPSWKTLGLPQAMCYIVFAILWVCHLGPWEGMHR